MAKDYYMVGSNGEAFRTSNPEWHKDARQVGKTEWQKARVVYCRARLKKLVRPGDTVYTILRHVSSSGMMRHLSLIVIDRKTRQPITINHLAADLCGYSTTDQGYIRMGGCGMDMGFAAVYSLGASIWPKGTPRPHGTRNGEPDKAGGYALKHSWL